MKHVFLIAGIAVVGFALYQRRTTSNADASVPQTVFSQGVDNVASRTPFGGAEPSISGGAANDDASPVIVNLDGSPGEKTSIAPGPKAWASHLAWN